MRLSLLLALLLAGCDAFPYGPNVVDLPDDQQQLNRKNLARLAEKPGTLPFRFAVISDTHFWDTETRDAVRALEKRDDLDFVVHCGDLVQFGLESEFGWLQGFYAELPQPFLPVIGNHDHLSNGVAVYEAMYGKKNYSFVHARTKFIFVDDNSREYDFDGKVPDFDFLEAELQHDASWDRAVVVAHMPPWSEDFDPDLQERWALTLRNGGAILSLHGHLHRFLDEFRYQDGVRYVVADAMRDRNYLVITIGDTVEVEQVFF